MLQLLQKYSCSTLSSIAENIKMFIPFPKVFVQKSVAVVEYTDCIFAEG